MKPLILTLALTAFFKLSFGQEFASASIILMDGKDYSRIIVAYGDGESEVIPLINYTIQSHPSRTNEWIVENHKTINRFLADMVKRGYKLVTSSGISSTGSDNVATVLIFKKE